MFIIPPFVRTRSAKALFFGIMVFFVSFRYETGFDWPVYKGIFEAFQSGFTLTELASYSTVYSQESGFLLFVGILAGFLPNYEVFQALISVIFLISVWRLALVFGATNVALVFALVFSYLLLTVGFSTVRQSLAIALFNFGLIAIFSNRRWFGTALFMLSVAVQNSAAIYIATFFVARFLIAYNYPTRIGAMVAVAVSALIVMVGNLPIVTEFFPSMADRWAYYANLFSDPPAIGRWDLFFIVMFIAILLHSSMIQRNLHKISRSDLLLSSMIIVLCVICLTSMFFPIIRDRASYLLWVLYSILLAKDCLSFKWVGRLGAIVFGLAFTLINVLSYPSVLAFVPYENFVICHFSGGCSESAGERQRELFDALDEILSKASN